ncbi:MAG: patatin-like phospholipase family protein [SAR324 cluster bacterium]|nr:patatin-like phospholipase family protein [SAR324 cluster bacterium]
MNKKNDRKTKFALVLSGGGARGAYEAGVVHYLRTALPPEIAESTLFDIYSGTSVGAVNSAFLASTAHDPVYQGTRIRRLWRELTAGDIYCTDINALFGFLVKTGFFTATNFLGLNRIIERKLGAVTAFPFKGLLDTSPTVHFLRRNIQWKDMHRNIAQGVIAAITVTATQMANGQPVVFVEKGPDVNYVKGAQLPVYCQISAKHILGSAAIPIVFPLIRINQTYFGDGSLRQNTPLSPAINLGAERVLIISMVSHSKQGEVFRPMAGEPTLGDISGQLLDSIFLDKLDYDLRNLRWVNFLIQDLEAVFGPDMLEKLNAYRASLNVPGQGSHSVNKIVPFVISPSEDIGAIAARHLNDLVRRERVLSPVQRFFQKIVEGSPDESNDLVSYLLFDRDYLAALIDLGYEDARRAHDHLILFFSQKPLSDRPGPAI